LNSFLDDCDAGGDPFPIMGPRRRNMEKKIKMERNEKEKKLEK